MIGKILGGGDKGGGLLGGLLDKLNPMKMLDQLKQLPEQLMGGVLGGKKAGGAKGGKKAGGAEDVDDGDETNPLSAVAQLDPTGLLQGLVGAAGERGLA